MANHTQRKDFFEMKRRLVTDAKAQLNRLPCEPLVDYYRMATVHNERTATRFPTASITTTPSSSTTTTDQKKHTSGLVFVYEWCDDDKSNIFGYGCNLQGDACLLPVVLTPRLFVVSPNPLLLKEIMAIQNYNISMYPIYYTSNNFNVFDLFLRPELATRKCQLCAIEFPTIAQLNVTYCLLRNNDWAYKYAVVTQYYDVTKQIMFELLLRQYEANGTITIPQTTMQWFDYRLNVYNSVEYPAPVLPLITFDIETVSDDPHRVPTGDDVYDILYSVSIHHGHTNILYTLIYLPVNGSGSVTNQNLRTPFEKMYSSEQLRQLVMDDGYDVVPDKKVDATQCQNVVECFVSEQDLLQRTMDLLTLRPKLHILMGYNSMGYDIKYLLMRCTFFNICLDEFLWRDGYCYTPEQIHIDLFRTIMMRYRLKSYSLNEVSAHLLRDSKTGVSAVALRYTFFNMLKQRRFQTHDESTPQQPSIRDTLHYNNADTLLVSKLEARTQSIQFLVEYAQRCQVPLSTMMTNYNKMQYKLWNECLVVGLNLGVFMGRFKNASNTELIVPMGGDNDTDLTEVRANLTDNLNGSDMVTVRTLPNAEVALANRTAFVAPPQQSFVTGRMSTGQRYLTIKKNAKFPGGANFCLGEYDCDNVQMYDYVTAYPLLMDRKNISDETTTILPANVLAMYYPKITNPHEYTCFDYLTHHGRTHSETSIIYYQYIFENLYCGGEFPFQYEELVKRGTSLVICIWQGSTYEYPPDIPDDIRQQLCTQRRGVLAMIIAEFNTVRANTKMMRKSLESAQNIVLDRINQVTNEALLLNMYTDEYDDDDAAAVPPTSSTDNIDDDDNLGLEGFIDEEVTADDGGVVDDAALGLEGFIDSEENTDTDLGLEGFLDEPPATDDDDNDAELGLEGFLNDDNDDADNDNADDGVTVDDIALATPTEPVVTNPYKFKFANKYITIYENRACVINNELLQKAPNKLEILQQARDGIAIELSTIANSYDLQKNLVSSIYGCVGKMIPVVAAAITCITRSTLLKSAQYCRRVGNEILYIDTDSIMMSSQQPNLSADLNRLYPYMEMEMKTAAKCMFVKRKTYYRVDNGQLKYGQNVNGPVAWRDCVVFFYKYRDIRTNDDISKAFVDFFEHVYTELQSAGEMSDVVKDRFTHTIKLKDNYKTATVAYKLRQYLAMKYPEIAGANRQTVYYLMDRDSLLMPQLRPAIEINTLDDLQHVNLFKYYQNMYTTIFNLIKFNVRRNNKPFHIALLSKSVLLQMVAAYLDVYERTFKHLNINRIPLNTDQLDDAAFELTLDQLTTTGVMRRKRTHTPTTTTQNSVAEADDDNNNNNAAADDDDDDNNNNNDHCSDDKGIGLVKTTLSQTATAAHDQPTTSESDHKQRPSSSAKSPKKFKPTPQTNKITKYLQPK